MRYLSTWRKKLLAGLLVLLAATVVVGIGGASIPAADGTYTACVSRPAQSGTLKGVAAVGLLDTTVKPTCPPGANQVTWNQGSAGSGGGLTGYTVVENFVQQGGDGDGGTFVMARATCPAGTRVINGSVRVFGSSPLAPPGHLSVAVVENQPSVTGDAWEAGAQELGFDQQVDVLVRAICVEVSP